MPLALRYGSIWANLVKKLHRTQDGAHEVLEAAEVEVVLAEVVLVEVVLVEVEVVEVEVVEAVVVEAVREPLLRLRPLHRLRPPRLPRHQQRAQQKMQTVSQIFESKGYELWQ